MIIATKGKKTLSMCHSRAYKHSFKKPQQGIQNPFIKPPRAYRVRKLKLHKETGIMV
jgi:hypothetical protein